MSSSDIEDLVYRLRHKTFNYSQAPAVYRLMREAADEIERLAEGATDERPHAR